MIKNSKIDHLHATGLLLGAISEIVIHRASVSFEPDAVLVIYSDGVLERFNANHEEFGLEHLATLIVQHQHKAAQEILDIIYQTVFDFGDQATWQDDVTIVIIKRVAE